uniref:ATPase dynein-related AAA domain-containing protein n=1 Tax=Eptatretus burgeri TaxID=7764 RepID=A0A8C4NK40_EPTBU
MKSSGEGVVLSKKRRSKLKIADCPAIDGSDEPTRDGTSKLTASVNVCGVILSQASPAPADETRLSSLRPPLVMVSSTVHHMRSLALAVSGHRPVLLEGPVGCGKTALVEFLATQTGLVGCNRLLTVQLGDQTDSRALPLLPAVDVGFFWKTWIVLQQTSSPRSSHYWRVENSRYLARLSCYVQLPRSNSLLLAGCNQVASVSLATHYWTNFGFVLSLMPWTSRNSMRS